ncbi:MAG: hypothetical protein KKB22_06225, partial [Candidatus Omnitrophica bacterium]|nr:hypothetical protein [Candidatus Omnitrophota bacterium]
WENRASLFFTGISVLFLCHLPFYIASGSSFLKYFVLAGSLQYKGIEGLILKSIFAALYLFMVINSIKDSRLPHREEKLFYYFLIILLLSFTTFPMRLRYFVSVTPLLALLIPHNKKFGIAAVFIVLIIAFLSLSDRSLQMGLFAPLGQRFLDMPAFQEVIGRYMNIELIYKFASRVLLVLFFAVSLRLWRIKSKNNSRVLIK